MHQHRVSPVSDNHLVSNPLCWECAAEQGIRDWSRVHCWNTTRQVTLLLSLQQDAALVIPCLLQQQASSLPPAQVASWAVSQAVLLWTWCVVYKQLWDASFSGSLMAGSAVCPWSLSWAILTLGTIISISSLMIFRGPQHWSCSLWAEKRPLKEQHRHSLTVLGDAHTVQ